MIKFTLNVDSDAVCSTTDSTDTGNLFNWFKADWAKLNSFFEIYDWSPCFTDVSDVNTCLSNMCQIIDSAISVYVSTKQCVKINKRKNRVLGYTTTMNKKHVKRALNKKKKMWRTYRE